MQLTLRKKMALNPFMKSCVWTGEKQGVSWEHCWIYGGKQINEEWAIVPLRRDLNVNMQADVKEFCRWVSLNRATDEDFAKYPKKDWKTLKKYLNKKYGIYNPTKTAFSQRLLAGEKI